MNRCLSILVFATLLTYSASAQQRTVSHGAEPSAQSVAALEHMLGRLPRLGSTARANTAAGPTYVRSDLLRIEVPDSQPVRAKLLRLFEGKGPILAESDNGLVDLLAVAPFADFQVTPIFDGAEYPNGPNQYHVIFGPVTMAPNQEFFGLIGVVQDPGDTPLEEAEFRESVFADFEVEIDGLMVRGEEFRYGEHFMVDEGQGPAPLSYFDYSQRISTRGTHRLIYRFTNRMTRGDCNVDCLNAGTWVFDFTIEVQ